MAVGLPVLFLAVSLGITTAVPVESVEETPNKEDIPVFFPAMLVDKLLYLEQSLINHTAEVGVYVLLLEDTQFDPPIYPLVRVILMLNNLHNKIRPDDRQEWPLQIQNRHKDILKSPSAELVCTARVVKTGKPPSNLESYFQHSSLYDTWWQIAVDTEIDTKRFDDVTYMTVAEISNRLDGLELLVRFTRYILTATGDLICSSDVPSYTVSDDKAQDVKPEQIVQTAM